MYEVIRKSFPFKWLFMIPLRALHIHVWPLLSPHKGLDFSSLMELFLPLREQLYKVWISVLFQPLQVNKSVSERQYQTKTTMNIQRSTSRLGSAHFLTSGSRLRVHSSYPQSTSLFGISRWRTISCKPVNRKFNSFLTLQ